MKLLLKTTFVLLLLPILTNAQQTLSLENCYDLVNKNYPLAKQTELLQQNQLSKLMHLTKGNYLK
jgi:hypothetical protein